ncbi:DUF2244 domain-containing protein [Roseomonas sp. NAR14]|uniref:DUF2244 domain-containing protein n=1 Tax=Roseomonas acroporae TaxID=2937791 RepID=A0A9X2BWN8_9PROT|nr:DUF2244 domain-containing protein [Roseomonas acroporae]MCK8784080.1 DUF2244 domain-containing protein [Roseomonas acroporae]
MAAAGPVPLEPILFEAVTSPHRSAGPRALTLLTLLLGLPAMASGLLFLRLGAWPVFGLVGLEVPAVLLLVMLHHRGSRHARESVVLTPNQLQVRRTDRRGRRSEVTLEPYWARLELREHHGRCSTLLLAQRRASVEIGTYLGEWEKRDLAAALGDALRRYREPVFDNPQLRAAQPFADATPTLARPPTRSVPGS